MDKRISTPNWRTVYGVPIVVGLLSLSGLASALLLDETGRYFSWIAVGSPVFLVAWLLTSRAARRRNG
ncbi:hypothetical protein [Bradyrhizobium sp. dw_411]|uniref:hypothetical protein n=1 Tax=Bradyrhizobium sp. dw_411 TaxID=2720082 RepID=UPI001BCCA6D7|nr:hypothetical protein [Bradyrhizobium sp. dw_411]